MGITHKRQKWCFSGFGLSGKKFLWKEKFNITAYRFIAVNLLCKSRYLWLLRCILAVAG